MALARSRRTSIILYVMALDRHAVELPYRQRAGPSCCAARAHGETVSLALLGANETRRRRGLVRSRGLYLNETGDPRFDALTIEHNGILAAAEWELVSGMS